MNRPAGRPETDEHWRDGEAPAGEEQVETLSKRLDTRTWVGAVAAVLALALGIVAMVVALDARDSAIDRGDLRRLQRELAQLAGAADDAAAAQQAIDSLSGRIDALQSSLEDASGGNADLAQQLDGIATDLAELRDRVDALESSPPADQGPQDGLEIP